MKDLSKVIVRPLITERGTDNREQYNQYSFQVAVAANKLEIRQAIEHFFGVKVTAVRTMNYRGKIKRMGRHEGKRADSRIELLPVLPGVGHDLPDGLLKGVGLLEIFFIHFCCNHS